MVAYEGVRGDAIQSPIASVPTALMRQGNFSEITTPIRDPRTGQPFPGNIIPTSRLSPTSLELLQYYPDANLPGTANNFQGPSTFNDNVDQFLGRVDQNLGNKVRLSLRYNWHDSYTANPLNALIPVAAVTQPRTNKNWLFGYTHTLRSNLAQRFQDRLPPHRLRHAEPVLGERARRRGHLARHPRLRRRHAVRQPGPPERQHQQLHRRPAPAAPTGTSSTRPSRSRTSSPGRAARTPSAAASTCGG